MNRGQLLGFFDSFTDDMRKTMEAKNSDYTGGEDAKDAFANFTRVELMGIASTEQGFLARMMDKFCRINSFVQNGTLSVADEKVTDTLKDLANYSILMAAYISEKKEQAAKVAMRE